MGFSEIWDSVSVKKASGNIKKFKTALKRYLLTYVLTPSIP
jgi:hypothetical protein